MAAAEPWKTALGVRARALRERTRKTRQEIADESGLSLRFLADVEGGKANPSLGSLHALADALGVTVVDLVTDEQGRPRSIALLGLRGAGKSTVGKRAAKALGWTFVEVDKEIEREAGMALSELFALHGEQHYRTLEARVLRALLLEDDAPRVLATGGGVVTHDDSWALLRAHALTVWLKASPQEHWDRVVAQGDARPMQKRSQARAELQALYEERAPLYARADVVVNTSALDVDGASARIVAAAR
jgi:XRE family aerobic/anaerobic benzoate catabolism transcriptional regulator